MNSNPQHPQNDTDPARTAPADSIPAAAEALGPGLERSGDEAGGMHRRDFLGLLGATMAAAGASGCVRPPAEKIVPYVESPEQIVPGKPLFFATSMPRSGDALGLVVESHMGRPTKIEGNKLHPGSKGGTDAAAQAEVLTLYDPDRSQTIRRRGRISTWSNCLAELQAQLASERNRAGAGVRLLTPPVASPTQWRLIEQLLSELPGAQWYIHQPISRQHRTRATAAAYGAAYEPLYDFEQADIVVSLDDDFLTDGPGHTRYARDFADRRRVLGDQQSMNRFYVAECSISATGSKADHRLALRPSRLPQIALELLERLRRADAGEQDSILASLPKAERDQRAQSLSEAEQRWLDYAAADLGSAPGRSIIVAGPAQPLIVHLAAGAINQALGNIGKTVRYFPRADVLGQAKDDPSELCEQLDAGEVGMLLMLGGNPAYDTPADLDFGQRIEQADLSLHLSLFYDETSRFSKWHVPALHFLESWSDTRWIDGTASIVQPLLAPLYQGRSEHELLAALLDLSAESDYERVRATWRQQWSEGEPGSFERLWERSLHDGVVAASQHAAETPPWQLDGSVWQEALKTASVEPKRDAPRLELSLRADPTIGDGQHANNAWLQELPKPITKLTWDNALLLSPGTAEQWGLANEEVVRLSAGERSVEAPVWLTPLHPDGCATLHLGYGRPLAGSTGGNRGVNAYQLRTTEHLWTLPDVALAKTGSRYQLACTQEHFRLEGDDIARVQPLEAYLGQRTGGNDHASHPPLDHAYQLQGEPPPRGALQGMPPPEDPESYAWGMAIDMSACIDCGACVVACQAENNIPTVGKDGVALGREMHWLRIDRYYEGELDDDPHIVHQPMLCQHCEKAPCEVVCPVAAAPAGSTR